MRSIDSEKSRWLSTTFSSSQSQKTLVKWLDCRTCNHRVVGSNPAAITTDLTIIRILSSSYWITIFWFCQLGVLALVGVYQVPSMGRFTHHSLDVLRYFVYVCHFVRSSLIWGTKAVASPQTKILPNCFEFGYYGRDFTNSTRTSCTKTSGLPELLGSVVDLWPCTNNR